MTLIIVKCPHCNEYIEISEKEINCSIFRHGIYKHNMKQIDPHSKKELCDMFFNKKIIYGCGKPFKLILKDGIYNCIICDYI